MRNARIIDAIEALNRGGSWHDDGTFVYYPPTDEPDDEGAIGELEAISAELSASIE